MARAGSRRLKPESFLAAVRDTMRRRGMEGAGRILVACSGGADSLALLHALHRLSLPLVVAHFDHGVRAGSAADAAFVGAQARRLGLEFALGRAPSAHRRRGESPEEALRRERLAFLEQAARENGAARIATGHTRDDQAETVLMRLVSGTGRRGLSGIPPVRGPYIRPLIDVGRADTEGFCASLRLRPRQDETNADPSLLRNAIRADLLPSLAAGYNARVAEALARLADVFRDEDALLDEIAAEAADPEVREGGFRLKVEDLLALHPAIQRRAVRRLVPLDAASTERVRRLVLEGATGDAIDLPQGLNARLEYGWLVLGRAAAAVAAPAPVALEVPGVTDLPGWNATMRAWLTANRPQPLGDGVTACALDADRAGTLVVRAPRTGDRFRPLGMARSKKLGDFFTDAKVPQAERAVVPLVAQERGAIAWVAGHRIDDRFKVSKTTKRILVLELTPNGGGG